MSELVLVLEHVWRLPNKDEPYEVGGVCVVCGRYADTDEPCEEEIEEQNHE